MKIGVMVSTLLFMFVSFSGVGLADTIVKGTVILISGGMYTVKTDSTQGFRGSRETFYISANTTQKTGDIKVGSFVEVEINANGTANWVNVIDSKKNDTLAPKE